MLALAYLPPASTADNTNRPPNLPSTIHIRSGYGQVGTGSTPEAAQADLMEKIRQAREV